MIQRLADEVHAIIGTPDVKALLTERGFEVMNTTPAEFANGCAREFEVITKRIREFGIEVQ